MWAAGFERHSTRTTLAPCTYSGVDLMCESTRKCGPRAWTDTLHEQRRYLAPKFMRLGGTSLAFVLKNAISVQPNWRRPGELRGLTLKGRCQKKATACHLLSLLSTSRLHSCLHIFEHLVLKVIEGKSIIAIQVVNGPTAVENPLRSPDH